MYALPPHFIPPHQTYRFQIWEISTKYVRNAFKGHKDCTNSLDFSPDDRRVVSASDDDSVVLWNMRFGFEKALRAGVVRDALDSHCYTSALFSPDGKHVAASHNDGTVRVWSVGKGTIVRRLAAGVDWVNDLAFFPDGSGLVSGGRDRTLRCFDVSDVFEHGVEDETWGVRHLIGHKVRFFFFLFFGGGLPRSSPARTAFSIFCSDLS